MHHFCNGAMNLACPRLSNSIPFRWNHKKPTLRKHLLWLAPAHDAERFILVTSSLFAFVCMILRIYVTLTIAPDRKDYRQRYFSRAFVLPELSPPPGLFYLPFICPSRWLLYSGSGLPLWKFNKRKVSAEDDSDIMTEEYRFRCP